MITIRDPVHGSIPVTTQELAVLDSPVFQRLRGIKQLGFTELAFPGATHTRYAHGLGAMQVASRMFDALFGLDGGILDAPDRARLRQMLRLAVMLHDVGHPPASHASESCMPPRSALGLAGFTAAELAEQATHEDYTLKLIIQSELTSALTRTFGGQGIHPEDVAHLITGRYPERGPGFVIQGTDFYPLLTQMVSGEMDADRMDYLQRDSFYAGVNYGKFDQDWLLENLLFHVEDSRAYLALSHRAVFAFEDFLLSRFHMFVSVYYHYIPIGFDTMLSWFFQEAPEDFQLPTDADAYIATDDVALWSALRASKNRWARRISARQGFRRLVEVNAESGAVDVDRVAAALEEAGIEHFVSRDQGVLSKYYGGEANRRPIYVLNQPFGQATRMQDYSRIFERYAQPTPLIRLYCHPDQQARAREILKALYPSR